MSDAVLQVFRWGSECRRQGTRQYYDSFRLEDREYRVGDAVCLHPENASTAPFVGRLVSCFSDSSVSQVDPHCIQIQWYERLTNLEARYQGWTEKEHEVLELEETDVNPIGCIASKCTVFKAPNYEQAANEAARVLGPDDVWFFCRGVFRQSTGSFEPYQEFGGPAKTCSTHLATDAMSTHPPASLFSDDAGSGCDSEDATSATGASTPLAPASRPLPASIAAATSKRTRMSCLLPSSQLPALTVQHSSVPQTTAASSAVAVPLPSAGGAAGCCTEAGPEGLMLAGGASAGGAVGWVQADAAQSQAGQAPGSGTHTPQGAVGSVEAGTGAGLRSGGTGLARDSLGLASPSITSRAETGPGAGSGMVFLDDLSMSMTLTQGSYLASHAVGQGQGQGHSGMLSSSPPLPYLDWAASGSLARPQARHSLVGAGSSSLTPSLTTTSHPLGPPALQLATSARTGTPPPPQTQLGSPPATRRRQQQTAAVGAEVGVTCHTTSPAELGAQWGVPTRPGVPAAATLAGLPAALGGPGAAPLSSRAPAGGAAAAAALPHGGRSCLQCGVTTTPQWREGPMGPKTLCNACGVRYGRAQQRAGKQGGASAHDRRAAQGYDTQHRSAARAVQEEQQQQLPSRRGSTRTSARGRQGASAGSGSGAGSLAVVPPLTTLTVPASGAGEGSEGGVLTLVDPGPPQLGTPPAVLMLPLHPHTPSTAAAAAAMPGAPPLALATASGNHPLALSFSLDCLLPCAAAAAGGSTAADTQLLVQSSAVSPAPALVLASPLPTQSSLLSSCFTALHAPPSTPAAPLAASQAVGTPEAAGQVPEVCTSPHGHASQSRRPMRQAARMAASRTAEYARTGSFQAPSCTHPSPSQPDTHPVHPASCQEAQGRAQAAGHTTLEASHPALAPCTRTPGLPGPPSPPPSSPLPADLAAHSPNHSSLSDCDITTPLTQGRRASAHPPPTSSHQAMAASPSPGTGTDLCLASVAPSPGPVRADSSSTGAGGSGGAGQAAPHPAGRSQPGGLLGSMASPLKRRREEPSAPHSLDTALAAPPPAAHALASATPPKPAPEGMLPAPTPKLEPWSFEAIACSGCKPAPALAAVAAAIATAAPIDALLPAKHEGSQQVSGSGTAAGREQGVSGLTSVAGAAESQTADLAGVAEALAQFNAVKEKLPPDVLEALQAAGEGVTRAAAEVTAAEAALSAVHQVLLSRTKAAEEARQEALTALGHMQSFVRDLVGQYPHLQAASCAQLEGVTSSTLSNMEDVDEVFGWGDLGLGRTFSAAASSPATTLTTAAAMMGAFQSLDSSSGRGADKLGKSSGAAATTNGRAPPPTLSPDHTPNPASLPPRSARAAPAAAAAAQAAAAAAAQATAAAAAAHSDTDDLFQHPCGSSPWASSPHAQCSTGTRGGLAANNCFSSSNLQASGWLAGHGAGGGAGLPPLLNMDDMGMDAAWDSSCEGPGRQGLGIPCGHADHSMRFETHHELGLSSNRMFSGGLLGDLDDLMVFSAMA